MFLLFRDMHRIHFKQSTALYKFKTDLLNLWPCYNYFLQGNRRLQVGSLNPISQPGPGPLWAHPWNQKFATNLELYAFGKTRLLSCYHTLWQEAVSIQITHTDNRKGFLSGAYGSQSSRDGNSTNNPNIKVTYFGLWHYLPVHTDCSTRKWSQYTS